MILLILFHKCRKFEKMKIQVIIFLLTVIEKTYCQDDLEKCINANGIEHFPDFNSTCCKNLEWLVFKSGKYSCELPECEENRVLYDGECLDVFDDFTCNRSPGMRLFLGQDGLGYCDCLEGWFSFKGICYQEFTSAPILCPNKKKILRLKRPNLKAFREDKAKVLWPGEVREINQQLKYNYSCELSQCPEGSLPHSSSWNFATESGPCHPLPPSTIDESNCEWALEPHNAISSDDDDPAQLVCCQQSERQTCYFTDDIGHVLFGVPDPDSGRRSCRNGCIYSEWRMACVGRTRRNSGC